MISAAPPMIALSISETDIRSAVASRRPWRVRRYSRRRTAARIASRRSLRPVTHPPPPPPPRGPRGGREPVRSVREWAELNHAHGAVPDDGLAALQRLREHVQRRLADVHDPPALRHRLDRHALRLRVGREAVGDDDVGGQEEDDALLPRPLPYPPRPVEEIVP